MYRTTADLVCKIVQTPLVPVDVEPFVRTANLVVTEHLGTSGLSEETLAEIELWLAAHFVCIHDQQLSAIGMGTANYRFNGKTGMGLDFTPYGQHVKFLDTTGVLAGIGQRRWKYLASCPPTSVSDA